MAPEQISIIILVVVMVLYATEVIPLAVTALGSCAAMAILGLATSDVVWSGLAADTTLVVGGMVVVGNTLIETGVAESLGRWILRKTGGRPVISCTCLIIVAMILSGFMNNSAAIATMMPVMIGVAATAKDRIHEKQWLLPMAVATNAGGMLSLIGTTSQMIVQSALQEQGYPVFAFFDFAWLGIPLSLLFLLYMGTIGRWLGKRMWPDNMPHTQSVMDFNPDAAVHEHAQGQNRKQKQIIAVVIMLTAIALMVMNVGISNGTIAMTAAGMCIITRCVSIKQVFRQFDWTTIFVLAGGIGFANGLDYCGGGQLIAEWLMGLFHNSLTPVTVFIMFVVVGSILTQFMSNTAVAAMLTPIALPFVTQVGVNPLALLMGICAATNLSFSTPIATPSMTLVLGPGEYRFMDYVKWCTIFNIICTAAIIIIIPMVWPLELTQMLP